MSHANWAMIQPKDGVEAHQDYVYDINETHVSIGFNHSLLFVRIDTPKDASGCDIPLDLWIKPGKSLRIDCIDNRHAVKPVKRVIGNVVQLKEPLRCLPVPGGQVKLIHGPSQSYIDMRIRDWMEKNKLLLMGGQFIRA
jgi:hypothetical protein